MSERTRWIAIAFLCLLWWYSQYGIEAGVLSSPATAATYVYEKDQTAIPPQVAAGLNQLNRERKIIATTFEEDTVDRNGEVPDQYKAALPAAQDAGLPALVVLAGDTVIRVVNNPQTVEQVVGAVP